MQSFTYSDIAKMLDHSLLQPTLTDAELEKGCLLAKAYAVASVCIKPYAVAMAKRLLDRSGVAVGTVIGFPHGGHLTTTKVVEAQAAMADGATELDMVVNIGKVRSEDWDFVRIDIAEVVETAHRGMAIVKVIFENSMLKRGQKIMLCRICGEIKADFVKTSTGYGDGGATDEDLKLMREYAPKAVQVKAAGGVRTFERLMQVRELSVTRVGATATPAILDECRKQLGLSAIAVSSSG
jgi:deoxyribose-phosphate aldolase